MAENQDWLPDHALFMDLKGRFNNASWTEWPEDIRLRWDYALDYYRRELYFDIEFQQYLQFVFFSQWQKLKAYANKKGIKIIGDIPIYVSQDGVDRWTHAELFQVDEKNNLSAVAGCPPDSFSADGQIWGNPLYRWDYHRATGYDWWITRLYHTFRLYDAVRLDHFRGFDEYFSVPFGAKSALTGHWERGPGMELFNTLRWRLGEKELIVEDLGLMTDSVRQLVKDSGYPTNTNQQHKSIQLIELSNGRPFPQKNWKDRDPQSGIGRVFRWLPQIGPGGRCARYRAICGTFPQQHPWY